MTSDNDSAFAEDEEDIDVPQRKKNKAGSRYSSKKYSSRARHGDGYSSTGMRSGLDSEADDNDDRSSSTSGLYGGGLIGGP